MNENVQKNSQMDDPERGQRSETTQPGREAGFDMNDGLSCFRGVINAFLIEALFVFVCCVLYKVFWG